MRINPLWFVMLSAAFVALLVLPTEKGQADIESPAVASQLAPTYTICSGTYALCTRAKCQPISSGDATKLSCRCTVRRGYSAGTKSCQDVPQRRPKAGEAIPSRYYPIKSTAVCSNSREWAFCLDSQCTVDPNLSKATCTCTRMSTPNQPYVVVKGSYRPSTCTTDIWSSATVEDLLQITGFLQQSKRLKPFPITIVGVGSASK